QNLGAVDLTIPPKQLAQLDAASRVDLGFPHAFLRSDTIRDVVHGNIAHLIDDHRGHYPFTAYDLSP
ncbi:MAG: aldo/keto reductase, partial [Egibacteraceae bacterium]